MPKTGASSVPTYCNAQNSVRANTEPVSTRMYQTSTRFSISMPQEVKRSAGHWKRKLRTRNGASIADEEKRVMGAYQEVALKSYAPNVMAGLGPAIHAKENP